MPPTPFPVNHLSKTGSSIDTKKEPKKRGLTPLVKIVRKLMQKGSVPFCINRLKTSPKGA